MAALLGYSPSGLSFLLYKVPAEQKYTTFAIPKKSGGERQIDAPVPRIKRLQKKLADLLYACAAEIEAELEATGKKKNKLSHAFRQGFSIVTNAKVHRNRRYVLNLDLKDFFPSLNFGRVRGFFLKNNAFLLSPKAATIIAQIACHNGRLPQGSPCSPVLSELLTHFLDIRLATLARKYQCTYSRYADDLTLSTNQKEFPAPLAVETAIGWIIGDILKQKIENSGFSINDAKTHMQLRARQQTVTGLVVNEKVNVRQDYYKRARAMAHSLFMTGGYNIDGIAKTTLDSIEGILNHVYHVKERLIDIAIEKEANAELKKKKRVQRAKQKHDTPSAARVLLHRFLFYRHFIDPRKPIVLCEGTTDSVYLKAAIRMLPAFHASLSEMVDGKFFFLPNFFKYTDQSKDLLQMRGGTGDLKYFLNAYKNLLPKYKHAPMENPVIVLIDNDSGATSVFKLMENLFHVTASKTTDLPFYHLSHNLYLIKTPPVDADGSSHIEQFFEPALLETLIDGKRFNPDKEHEAPGEYGKTIFAEKVVRPGMKSISFAKFTPILERIVAVIDKHKAVKLSAGT